MPELPDITVYIEALESRILGQTLESVRIVSPFLLRTATPPLADASGKKVLRLRRLGKRICIGLEDDLWLVLHLMIAGRLHWHPLGVSATSSRVKVSPPRGLAAFDFTNGSILWTEAGSKSVHLSTLSAAKTASDPSIQAAWKSSTPLRKNLPQHFSPPITLSSVPSPILASSAVSATPTPTKSSGRPSSRPSR